MYANPEFYIYIKFKKRIWKFQGKQENLSSEMTKILNIRGYYDRGCRQFRLLTWNSFISQSELEPVQPYLKTQVKTRMIDNFSRILN